MAAELLLVAALSPSQLSALSDSHTPLSGRDAGELFVCALAGVQPFPVLLGVRFRSGQDSFDTPRKWG